MAIPVNNWGVYMRKNNHPKPAWRQVRLEIEGLDWNPCGRARTGISMVAKSWNAASLVRIAAHTVDELAGQAIADARQLLEDRTHGNEQAP